MNAGWHYDLRLALAPYAKSVLSLLRAVRGQPACAWGNAGERVSLTGAHGEPLAGAYYRPAGDGPHPAVLLLHGSSPYGRRLGLYRVLGAALARQGYLVLSLDQRGYGDSPGPARLASVADLDFAADACLALAFLRRQPAVDPQRTFLVGHSFGGDVAMAAARQDRQLRALVVIGPGRRYQERVAGEFGYYRRRATRYMGLRQNIPAELFLATYGRMAPEFQLDHYGTPGHVPLLMIDGAAESRADRHFLAGLMERVAPPKQYVTLAGADHYANIAQLGPLIVYDRAILAELVALTDGWLRAATLTPTTEAPA